MWRVAVLTVVCLLGVAAPAQAKTVNAGIGEFLFRAERVRVEPGDAVTWTNRGDVLHNVTSRRGAPEPFRSADLESGQAFSRVFAKAGTYDYLCSIHPDQMRGTVQVGPDRVKPTVTGSAISSFKRLRVRLRLSERASVKVTVTRRGKVVRTLRGRRLAAGSRELSGKALPKGTYRVRIQATDLEGNRSKVLRSTFPVT
jgi:plastocyanin